MGKYRDQAKLSAVRDYCSGEAGLKTVAQRHGVNVSSLRQWIAGYRTHGEEGVRTKKRAPTNFSAEFKLSVLKRMHEEGLLSTHPRWCPLCFLEWRNAGHEPYLPLIWQAAPILVCPVHSMALQYECPTCRRVQPFVPRHAHVDFCSRCGSWLAANHKELRGIAKASRLSPQQRYNIDAIGEMILRGPEISELLTAQHLQTRTAEIADHHFDGNPPDGSAYCDERVPVARVSTYRFARRPRSVVPRRSVQRFPSPSRTP